LEGAIRGTRRFKGLAVASEVARYHVTTSATVSFAGREGGRAPVAASYIRHDRRSFIGRDIGGPRRCAVCGAAARSVCRNRSNYVRKAIAGQDRPVCICTCATRSRTERWPFWICRD
jgi:hypothetical protein